MTTMLFFLLAFSDSRIIIYHICIGWQSPIYLVVFLVLCRSTRVFSLGAGSFLVRAGVAATRRFFVLPFSQCSRVAFFLLPSRSRSGPWAP